MSEELSNLSPHLIYISIYDKATGERITSLVTKIHAETEEQLTALAEKKYPDAVRIRQTAAEYNAALQGDLIYKDGSLVPRSAPTEDELRQQALASLDDEYSQKISNVETEMAKAKAVEDEDYYSDLKAQRETLAAEYTTKREAI